MSLFPINRTFRRFNDPFDNFFGHNLDLFDPFYDFDRFPSLAMPSSFRWINEPRRHQSLLNTPSVPISLAPAQSEKFRVQLNVAGFNPETIQTRVDGRKLIVQAKQEDRNGDDYNVREIRKSYDLPQHADINNVASFVTPNNMLVVEVPVRNPEVEQRMLQSRTLSDTNNHQLAQFGQFRDPLFDYGGFGASAFSPKIVATGNGQKQLQMSLPMRDYRPEQIKVSVKDNDLVVQGEHNYKDNNRSEKSYFYKSVSLPPGTQIDQLQSHLTQDGELQVEAPFYEPTQQSLQQHRQQIEVNRQ
ncbi:unnamed protein product [Didymodactylos carnosus]|uniref:SHSP domain-containing protein n=1 Tax=Didymodactylos carnosus TaxID=1234261 RepID=A0A815V0L8_9BILA|nr:unnamed protein product [Didymodactylos carnosus]CAF1529807.1 unnamed protein product [Didymodactylos carnosus]CAF4139982.1 unnamed protein product [Didymodactylos carnosus]CAF4388987.1 unnamed protein product [Didymodactylos carnosus]